MDLGLELTGDRAATLRFDRFPDAVHDRLLSALERIEKRLEAAVLADAPQRSGRLRNLIGGRVYDHGNRIAAVVGVNDKTESGSRKAAALEYGSTKKALDVRSHQARLDHFWANIVTPRMVLVRLHARIPNIAPQRYLRGPIGRIRPGAIAELRAALDGAVKDVG